MSMSQTCNTVYLIHIHSQDQLNHLDLYLNLYSQSSHNNSIHDPIWQCRKYPLICCCCRFNNHTGIPTHWIIVCQVGYLMCIDTVLVQFVLLRTPAGLSCMLLQRWGRIHCRHTLTLQCLSLCRFLFSSLLKLQ